jgi:hypothetical protein
MHKIVPKRETEVTQVRNARSLEGRQDEPNVTAAA